MHYEYDILLSNKLSLLSIFLQCTWFWSSLLFYVSFIFQRTFSIYPCFYLFLLSVYLYTQCFLNCFLHFFVCCAHVECKGGYGFTFEYIWTCLFLSSVCLLLLYKPISFSWNFVYIRTLLFLVLHYLNLSCSCSC